MVGYKLRLARLSLLCAVVNLVLPVALLSSKTRHGDLALSHMGPAEAFTTAWRKAFTYGGKATRAEYWWFFLTQFIVILVLQSLGNSSEFGAVLFLFYGIASIFPNLSLVVRRLRDIGKQWQWIFISLVPFIGGIWFIILMCQPSVLYETN